MDSLDIFVSSKTKELIDERKSLKKLLESISKQIHAFSFEDDASASKSTVQEVFREEIIKSKIYVGIFKNEYSSATKEEYELALDKNKDILIYVNESEIQNRDEQLKVLLKKVSDRHVIHYFTNKTDLEQKVKDDVLRLLIKKYNLA